MKKKQIIAGLKIFLLAIILGGGVMTLSAYTAKPVDQTKNAAAPISTSEIDQSKNGGLGLKSLLVGITNHTAIDADGNMAIGFNTTENNNGARVFVNGLIRVSSLVNSSKPFQAICVVASAVATSTEFKTCPAVLKFKYEEGHNEFWWQVPTDVKNIVVEVYGAGGGGSLDAGPGGLSRFSGGTIGSLYGQTGTIGGGMTGELIAYGGMPGNGGIDYSGGTSGTMTQFFPFSTSYKGGLGGSTNNMGSTNTNGQNGSNGVTSCNGACNGGKGGNAPGPLGGVGGTGSEIQVFTGQSGGGTTSIFSGGGAGKDFGGGSGSTGYQNVTYGAYFANWGGGGAGGYTKKSFTVKGGELFHVVIGKGGNGGGNGAVIITM